MFQRWLKYFFAAKTKYKIDSPFVYDFIENVLEDERGYYVFEDIEELRLDLLDDDREIKITDYGAGSRTENNNIRSIKNIAKTSLSQASQGQLLFRLINYFQPKNLLEMGTSLGLTTLYQAAAVPNSKFITMEGCPNIASISRQIFESFELEHIQQAIGEFGSTFDTVLKQFSQLDYVFFDGNHKMQPTIDYFNKTLPLAHNDTIFIFDDIHWSLEMEAAWKQIISHERVTLSIDLFHYGIVFFRKEQHEKTHYTLIHSKHKPWQFGFNR